MYVCVCKYVYMRNKHAHTLTHTYIYRVCFSVCDCACIKIMPANLYMYKNICICKRKNPYHIPTCIAYIPL